jgi:hypothetical protein
MTNRTDSTGGIYEGTAYGDKTFYGFKLDPATGDCTVEIIRSDDTDPIMLPQADNLGADDYKSHFWSIDSIEFEFNHSTGHLQMKFLS